MALLREKVKRLRKERGLTLEELAQAVGASKSSIWELENRDRARPSADKIVEISRVLGVTPEFLLNDALDSPTRATEDEAFYRKYEGLDEEKKRQVREILEILDRKE